MTSISRVLSAALLVGTTLSVAAPAQALPIAASQLRDASTRAIQTVQWRHGGWGGGHWGHRGGWGWGGVGVGFAVGAGIGAALAAPYYPYGYYAPGYYAYAPPYYAYGFRPRVHVRHYRHYRHYRW
jgi:hypothetical protein